jgi:nucleoside-diphosphate-sugar epimerase
MSHYLVTGGAGFIGSNIVRKLVEMGEQITVVDNLVTGRKENIAPYLNKITFIQKDLADENVAMEATRGIDYVLHQAAIPSVPRSIDNPIDTNNANINATLALLVACKENNVKRLVYASSSSIYGDQDPSHPKTETMPVRPKSPYGLQKYAAEKYCLLFNELYGLETICLRYFNVFGPNQDPTSEYAAVIPRFILAILKNESPTIFGDGKTSRDFTYVENNVMANITAATSEDGVGEVFNIAMGNSISLSDLVNTINKLLGKNIKPNHLTERTGDIKHSWADISKAEKLLGYTPAISFEQGLGKTIEYYKNK